MNLETFFEKFDQFADAPNAVKKMRDHAGWGAPSGLLLFSRGIPWALLFGPWALPFGPRALPWATLDRAVGAHVFRPKGANQASPGQRPGITSTRKIQALKGRPIP